MSVLRVGLFSDSTMQLQKLEDMVHDAGYSISEKIDAKQGVEDVLPSVDLWLVRIDLQSEKSFAYMEKLEDEPVPVIYDDAETYAGLNAVERASRFARKLEALSNVKHVSTGLQRAKKIWVLAASTGGPDAVMTFAKSIPDEIKGVAFLYVQHIDERMTESLHQILSRNTPWQVLNCDEPKRLYEKSFYLVSPEFQIDIDDVGCVIPKKEAWDGHYSPSIDQVAAKVAKKFGKHSGLIIFSGMGDDGAKACRLITHSGGVVWVQAPGSCAVDSMPNEAIATDTVSYIGTPELLAKEFVNVMKSNKTE